MTSQFSTLLKQLRLRAEMTQEGLAERSGVSVRTIRGCETGERADPRISTVRLLADALGLAPHERDELLDAAIESVALMSAAAHAAVERPSSAIFGFGGGGGCVLGRRGAVEGCEPSGCDPLISVCASGFTLSGASMRSVA